MRGEPGDTMTGDQRHIEDSASVLTSPQFLNKTMEQKFHDSQDIIANLPEMPSCGSQDLKTLDSQDLKMMGSQELSALGYKVEMVPEESFYIPLEELQFLGVLGKGGFAVVEKAKWTRVGQAPKLVAVKRLKADVIEEERELRAFAQEMAILKPIKHRTIAAFYGAGGTHDPQHIHEHPPYMVQELVQGDSLKQILYKQALSNPSKLYSERTALNWMLDVAQGLAHLHSQRPKIIHRDLKPDNVLLSGPILPESTAKLVDFGLATVAARRRSFKVQLADQLTTSLQAMKTGGMSFRKTLSFQRDGTFSTLSRSSTPDRSSGSLIHALSRQFSSRRVTRQDSGLVPSILDEKFALSKATGSYFYMAPEVFRGEPYNEMVDVFSFGIIMYELLHRCLIMSTAIVRGTLDEVEAYARRVAEGHRPALHPNLNPDIASLITRCWAPDSLQRPSMVDVAQCIQSILHSGKVSNEVNSGSCTGGNCVIS